MSRGLYYMLQFLMIAVVIGFLFNQPMLALVLVLTYMMSVTCVQILAIRDDLEKYLAEEKLRRKTLG